MSASTLGVTSGVYSLLLPHFLRVHPTVLLLGVSITFTITGCVPLFLHDPPLIQ